MILNQLIPDVKVGLALVGPDTPPLPPSPEPRKPQVKLGGKISIFTLVARNFHINGKIFSHWWQDVFKDVNEITGKFLS